MDADDERIRAELVLLARMIRGNPDLPDARRMWCARARGLAAYRARLRAGWRAELAAADGRAAEAAHAHLGSVARVLALCAATCGGPARQSEETGGAAAA